MRRAVVTGIGVVAPGGSSRESFWNTVTAGRSAVRRITFFDPSGFRSQIAAECDFDPYAAGLNDRDVRRLDRHIQLALAAAGEAIGDSGLDPAGVDHDRMGVALGTAVGGAMTLEEDYVALSNRGRDWVVDPDYASPFLYGSFTPSTLASEMACAFGAHGPAMVLTTGSVAGLDAAGLGRDLIAEGEADIVITGASESPITPTVLGSFDPIKATSARNDDPARASRPFDRDRDGFVLAEGAAVLVLEELEAALARHAHVYCEIAGYAARSNAYHMTGLKADGDDLAAAIRDAMRQANVRPSSIDYISAHASGSRQGDLYEAAAYRTVLGERARTIPAGSIKGAIGHALGAAGALQVTACALAIDRGTVPPTVNLDNPDPSGDLDYTLDRARDGQVQAALTTSISMGGFQSAMILARPSELRHGPGGGRT